jgi:hypothetical protein
MWTLECNVGCLLESRVMAMRSREEVEQLQQGFATAARNHPNTKFVICADYRRFGLLGPDASQLMLRMFQNSNPRVLRSGILVTKDSPTAALQIERVVMESAHPGRRAFRSVPQFEAWLDECLTTRERTRMREFLREVV